MDNTNYLTHHKPIPNDPTNDNKEAIITKKKNKNKNKGSLGNGGTKREMKLSTEPQSVAARERRHKISERFKILQSLVPCTNGTKMDTASMLEQAIQYVKFLKAQIWLHQAMFNFDHHDHDHEHAISHHGYGHDHVVGSHHHHHQYVSTEDNDDDYMVMSQMYGHHTCSSYGYDHDHQGEDAMSFDHTHNINGYPEGFNPTVESNVALLWNEFSALSKEE